MARIKSLFSCSECHYECPKWIGQCPQCSTWNSFVEVKALPSSQGGLSKSTHKTQPSKLFTLDELPDEKYSRFSCGMDEWDRVFGGGIVPGSFTILTGDPGVGKSTLLLHVADKIAQQNHKTLYFSSEESVEQVKGRALRLGLGKTNVLFSDEPSLENIIATAQQEKPALLILDSIQSCHVTSQTYSFPGSIGHLREAAFQLMRLAKSERIAVLITGHITKDGSMAGPKLLEHMVDGVFYLQGDNQWQTRILRSVKNRFGTVNEIGFFEMGENGMEQVSDLNHQMLENTTATPGSVLTCCMEGSRPVLVELQALCVPSKFASPQRVISGIDHKRVVIAAAILEKYLRIKMSAHDIFFKVSGSFFVKEPASDLAIILALLSSYLQRKLPDKTMIIGEVSLTGNIKTAQQTPTRIKEALKFGATTIITAKNIHQEFDKKHGILAIKSVYETLGLFPENEPEPHY